MGSVAGLFEAVVSAEASDLHVQVAQPPRIRVHGDLVPISGFPAITDAEFLQLTVEILSSVQRRRMEAEGEVDVAFTDEGGTRYRASFCRSISGGSAAFRRIPARIRSIEELLLPDSVEALAHLRRGLVLVTGATGSGKSSTLAAILGAINHRYARHIVTLEDPIEYLHSNDLSIVHQREFGEDFQDFARGVRDSLRADTDVLLVGELRDCETTHAALTAAETGLLVFGTLHTNDAPQTVDRLIDMFPAHDQPQVRAMAAESLAAVLSQALLARAEVRGLVPATELLRATPAISALIRANKVHEIGNAIQCGGALGMHRFDDSIDRLLREGLIDRDEAAAHSRRRSRADRKLVGTPE